jgi:hypothetical protein
MTPVTLIDGGFGDGSFEDFLSDFAMASRGEFAPMRKWGVDLSVRELQERDESVVESVARQLRKLET